ncbi:MAG TPA: hypothetical protein VFC78_01090 [Tepidisphaeraceae bacterium]|nr:hypothetical protein [Tepidisphaeraceae bacterium]
MSGSARSANRTPTDAAQAPSPATPSKTLSEAQYLEQQQAAAKSAISNAFSDVRAELLKTADPRVWVKSHPWMMVASAAVAGFTAAAVAVPSKEQQALKKLESIERALYGARSNGHSRHGPAEAENDGKSKKEGGFLNTLLHELVGAVKPAIISLLTAGMTQAGQPSAEEVADAARRGAAEQP